MTDEPFTHYTLDVETVYDPNIGYAFSAENMRALFPKYHPMTRRERIVERVFGGDWGRYTRYMDTQQRAARGEQAHDYCWGRGCVSCGCSETEPCISHRALRQPRTTSLSGEDVERIAQRVAELLRAAA